MYTRRKKEINHVSAAYFTEIRIHCDFGERIRVSHSFFRETFALISCKIYHGGSKIKHCSCVAVDTLLILLKMLKVFTLYT